MVLNENGYIDMLEGFTYDGPWPDQVKSFTLRYLDTAEMHCSKLDKTLTG